MVARPYSHPNFGNEVRLVVTGNEVMLTFIAKTPEQANSLADNLLAGLKKGRIKLKMRGKPTLVTEGN